MTRVGAPGSGRMLCVAAVVRAASLPSLAFHLVVHAGGCALKRSALRTH